MEIQSLCLAVKDSLYLLKGARTSNVIDHKKVDLFQKSIKDVLNTLATGYIWDIEVQAKGRSEKDSIDILGQAKGQMDWIIEIDATRTDQVSQKLLSRLTLWGLNVPIQYVAILYPDAHNKGKAACEKYLRYGNALVKKLNAKSSVIGIFVDPVANSVEVLIFNESNHFLVNGKECNSMTEAAAEAIKTYMNSHPISYAKLQQKWGKYVNQEIGPSRYKNVGRKTIDGFDVHSYTQFRQYGLNSYWSEFERLCKKNGISITKMKKIYTGGSPDFAYMV